MNEESTPGYYSRYRTIIAVLVKYGFEDLVAHSGFNSKGWRRLFPKRGGTSVLVTTRYERIRMVCEELGPTFVKFAQIISNRPDLLPQDLIIELEKLQDNVPPFSEDLVLQKIEREFDKSLDTMFRHIDTTPIASASLSQVHRAVLVTGEEVALKVQRPGIRKVITADIAILKDIAVLASKRFPEVALMRPLELIDTFERAMRKELNFIVEASSIKRFTNNFEGESDIYIPKVYSQYSSSKVLCLEYIDGVKISNLEAIKAMDIDTMWLAKRGVELYFKQIFEHGFFHADPHPGNLFVLKNKKICFLDFGMMGTILPADQEILADLIYYIAKKDARKLTLTIQRLAKDQPIRNIEDFEYEVQDFLEAVNVVSIDDVEVEEVVNGLKDVMYRYNLGIPRNLHLLLKALVMIEGVGMHLDPNYKVMDDLQPYAKKIFARKYDPRRLFSKFYLNLSNYGSILASLPSDTKAILEKIKKGKLHIEFEHKGLDPFVNVMDQVSKRLSFAIIVAAVIIGSALIVLAKIPPRFNEVSIIGIVGFVFAGLLSIGPLISILKRGKF